MTRHRGVIRGCDVTRTLVGLLLLVAAGLKAHQLATEPVPGEGLLTSRGFLILWVEVEILLGLWLVSGLYGRLAWSAAVGCFALFTVVTFAKAVRGDVSCGCFGRLEVSPWYTLILDLGAVTALVIFRPNLQSPVAAAQGRLRFGVFASLALAAGLGAGLAAALYKPATLSEEGQVVGGKRVVLLEPGKWVGKPCPLLAHIDIGKKLQKGRWAVVLYHHDCPHCEERVPQFEREVRKRAGHLAGTKAAMVELAPYAPPGKSLLPPDTACMTGRVSDARDWFVETPTVLTLNDGVVVDAKEGDGEGPNQARLAGLTLAPGEKAVPFQEGGYDFGFVEPKSAHKVLLSVTNPSDKPVVISKVRSECQCMSAVASERAVPPGQAIPVRVVLVAPKSSMHYHKRILLQTDDPKHPLIPMPIKAAVGLPLSTDPPVLELGSLGSGARREQAVTITSHLDKPVRLIYSTSSGSGCFARVPREPVPAMGRLTVPVVVTAQGTGQQTVTIRIQTDLASQPAVSVPIRFTVGGREPPGQPLGVGVGSQTRKGGTR